MMRPHEAGAGERAALCWGPVHVIWGLCYVAAGAVQFVAGMFALFTLPVLGLGSNVWTGAWNMSAGISGALLAGLSSELSAAKLELLLYASLSILGANTANLVILEAGEWNLLLADNTRQEIMQRGLSRLVYYARVSTSLSTAIVVVTSLLDSHISFCVLQAQGRRRGGRSLEPLADLDYVIPRKKTNVNEGENQNVKSRSHNQNAQSWVFDSGPTGDGPCLPDALEDAISLGDGSSDSPAEAPNAYLLSHGTPPTAAIVVKVEPAPLLVGEDRTMTHMKSFSRTPSPTCSLSHPIYECVPEDSPRSRLYTADYAYHQRVDKQQRANKHRRCESAGENRPHSAASVGVPEKIQYASLMLELEQAIQLKRPLESSPSSSDPTQPKDSDDEFSRELEAALQMLQDLGSPNAVDTPLDTCKSVVSPENVAKSPSNERSLQSMSNRSSTDQEDSSSAKTMIRHGKSENDLFINNDNNCNEEDQADRWSSGYSSPAHGISNTLPIIIISHVVEPNSAAYLLSNETTSTIYPIAETEDDLIELHPLSVTGPNLSLGVNENTWNHNNHRVTLGPEIANALLESETLVYLSELELLARHCRTKAEQRQIEQRVMLRVQAGNESAASRMNGCVGLLP